MANTFLTTKLIAREALPILKENLVFPALIHTDYSKDFAKQGDTIRIRKPNVYEAKDFTDGNDISVQDIVEDDVEVVMDKLVDVSVTLTAKQMALNLTDFNQEVVLPACVAIAEKINADGLKLYKDIPYATGTAGTTPSTLAAFANSAMVLNENKVPLQLRSGVWDPAANAAFSILDAIVHAEKSGSTQALREGAIGRIQGFNNYMAQSVQSHTTGITAFTTVKNNGAIEAGDTELDIDGTTITGKLVKGDIITISGKNYTVTEDSSDASSNAITGVKVYPALAAIADNTVVTMVSSHKANLAFHKNAFAFVSRALAPGAGVDSYNISYEGLNLRVTRGYDIVKKRTTMSIDTLYGYKTIYPELACRVLG